MLELLALAVLLQQSAVPAAPRVSVELPPGPAERAFAGVGPETAPARLAPAPTGALDAADWRAADAWTAWADAVRAETSGASGASPDAQRRGKLARIALAHTRWDDAWDHFAACSGDPAVCAALLPGFLPGVQAGAGAGGVALPLPDGVVLHPAPPPPSVP